MGKDGGAGTSKGGGGARLSYAGLRPKGSGGRTSSRRAGSGARFQRVQCSADADEDDDDVGCDDDDGENVEL